MSHKSVNLYKIQYQDNNIITYDNYEISDTLKVVGKTNYRIYIYKNFHLYIDFHGNKTCKKYETKEVKIVDNKYLQEYQEYEIVSIELFPFIKHYDKIIENCKITTYSDTINKVQFNVVNEGYVSYINIIDDIEYSKKIWKFIK